MTTPSYDHAALTRYPEYHAARQAIDALACALDRADEPALDRSAFIAAATDMAATSYAADCCDCPPCHRAAATGWLDLRCWPHAGRIDETGGLRGSYRCPRTGREWTCGYGSPEQLAQFL